MSVPPPRIVLDTNLFVSTIIASSSLPAFAVAKAFQVGQVLASTDTWSEIEEVLLRPKFDRHRPVMLRQQYLDVLHSHLSFVTITETIRICRDVKDDKVLELAVSGKADLIVTGDFDLQALHPFAGIPIISPVDFLALP